MTRPNRAARRTTARSAALHVAACLLAGIGGAAHAAPPRCPAAAAEIVERFTSADCAECWGQRPPGPAGAAPTAWVFDWIVPTAAGDDAPLSSAAVAEGVDRAERAGGSAPVGGQVLVQRSAPRPVPGLRLSVQSGPAWNGYFGLQFTVRGRTPAGSTGWLALVEQLPAGSQGSPVERQLLRAVAGPLPLGTASARPVQHLRALRWPATADPARLEARAWLETADGRVLAVAEARCSQRAP